MSPVSAATCPKCGIKIPLRALRQRMSGLLLLSWPKPGIVCGQCGQHLALHTARSGVVVAAAWVWLVGVFLLSNGSPSGAPPVILLVAALPLLLAYFYAPALASVSIPERVGDLYYFSDLGQSQWYRTAEARRQAEFESREEAKRVSEINDPSRRDWNCAACGAENPSTFDICWKCENHKVTA